MSPRATMPYAATPADAWPAVPSRHGASLLALLAQLEQTQWWSAERLAERQRAQLAALLRHACEHTPYYRERLGPGAADAAASDEAWRALPRLTRRAIQDAGAALNSTWLPPGHGPTGEAQTSGSTGEPVKVRSTVLDALMWEAMTLRGHRWHGRDPRGKLGVIRAFPAKAGVPPEGLRMKDWGPPAAHVYRTGPCAVLPLNTDIAVQAAWLERERPDYLLTYPGNLAALTERFRREGRQPPRLRSIATIGETVTPALRAACREVWQAPLFDAYSSQEMGYLALQCPQSEAYHVMAESALVEVLDDAGAPCAPGGIGRLVVTRLHGFATPLIRYEIGDYAEAGAPCPCGRGLPTLARIVGRSRNLVVLPDGRRHWPLVGFDRYRAIAPVRQYQLVQHDLEHIEVRLVVDRPLTEAEEAQLAEVIRISLGHAFRMRFRYYPDSIPRGPGGKFEEFISLVAT